MGPTVMLLLLIATLPMQIKVSVRPQVMLWGGDVRVECRVPRLRTHKDVSWGLMCPKFERRSTESAGRVLYETLIKVPKMECGTCYAFCEVTQHDRMPTVYASPMPLLVRGLGCDEEQD